MDLEAALADAMGRLAQAQTECERAEARVAWWTATIRRLKQVQAARARLSRCWEGTAAPS